MKMGAHQSKKRNSRSSNSSRSSNNCNSSKGSLVDVASFDFRREEMDADAEFRQDFFQSRFSRVSIYS